MAAALAGATAQAQQARGGPGELVAQNFIAGFTNADPTMVGEAEALLAQLGFNPGPQDGIVDQQTTNAVRQFQSQNNLPTSGLIDAELLNQLRTAAAQGGGRAGGFGSGAGGAGGGIAAGQLGVATVPALVVEGTNQVPGVGIVPTGIVREAQVHLESLGFGPGPADGIIGQETIQAISSFQSRIGMLPDGRLTPQVLQLLREVRSGGGLHITVTGNQGYQFGHGSFPQLEVLEIQRLLLYLGFYPGDVDGIYGPHTARAIIEYQKLAGLPADGRVSRPLLESLRRAAELNQFAGQPGSQSSTPFIGVQPPVAQAPVFLGPGGDGSGSAAPQQLGPGTSQPPLPGDDGLQLRGGITTEPQGSAAGPQVPPRQAGPQALVEGATIAPPGTPVDVDISGGTAGQGNGEDTGPVSGAEPIPLGSLADNLVDDVTDAPPIDAGGPFAPQGGAPVAAPREVVTLEELVGETPDGDETAAGDAATGDDDAAGSDESGLTLETAGGQAGASGATAPGGLGVSVLEQEAAAAASGYSQGLVLEVFRETALEANEFLGKLFDPSPMPFGYDVFLADRSVSEYRDARSVTLKWTGALSIIEGGNQIFRLAMTMGEDFNCDATLFIDGLQLLRLAPRAPGTARDETTFGLPEGPVPFQMRLTCDDPVPNDVVSVSFNVIAPGQSQDLALTPDRLFSKNPFDQ